MKYDFILNDEGFLIADPYLIRVGGIFLMIMKIIFYMNLMILFMI